MTAEELERLVNVGVPDKLVDALSAFDELQRKPLAKTAARLLREANDRRWVMPQISCEALAVLGLCS